MSIQGAPLKQYTDHFRQLRKDKNQNRYPVATKHAAPHKPLLHLSVFDRFAEGTVTENHIRLDTGLLDLFNDYWNLVMPDGWRSNIALPFYHLSNEDFWHLIPQPSSENVIEAGQRLRTIRKLKYSTRGMRLATTCTSF